MSKKFPDTTRSSSSTITRSENFITSVTPPIMEAARPLFFSDSITVNFLKPDILFIYDCTSSTRGLSLSVFAPSENIYNSDSVAETHFCKAFIVCCKLASLFITEN